MEGSEAPASGARRRSGARLDNHLLLWWRREFYQRKRSEKRSAVHALIALARRLVDVVWALIRDNREWAPTKPYPADCDTPPVAA